MTEMLRQGDLKLLEHPAAQQLLASTELARIAYVAHDNTPRVLPMLFHWTGEDVVMSSFAGTKKLTALRATPDVAISIDAAMPPSVLLVRGKAELTEVNGVVEEYRLAHRRYYGQDQGDKNVAATDQPGLKMVRISVRPTWVGVIDFVTRFNGGLSAEEFANRGQGQ
ncbi:MAG: pyridoxamine 5'-phosphate oxidase family protein [Actinomycetota bacterium]|nr:pyridoxamine 5'-phosphate oxidase family protein [Actinomycetota bacterium]